MLRFAPVVAVLACTQAFAQVRVEPLCLMWQNAPVGTVNQPDVAPFSIQDVHYRPYYPNPANPTPQSAAAALAGKVLGKWQAGTITADSVAVMLRGFGHDEHRSQTEWVSSPPCPDGSVPQGERLIMEVGFFQPVLDALPGLTINTFLDRPDPNPPQFPMRAVTTSGSTRGRGGTRSRSTRRWPRRRGRGWWPSPTSWPSK